MKLSTLTVLGTAFLLSLGSISSTAIAQSSPIPEATETKTDTAKAEIPEGTFSQLPSDHVIGQATAPITMIVYASVTCPHCSHWFKSVWPDIEENYIKTGKVKMIFREFPTAPAQLAIAGFQIANCGDEDMFFPIVLHQMVEQEAIFEDVKTGKGEERYLSIAKMAGVKDVEGMNKCFGQQAGFDRMQKIGAMADAAGIHGVPSAIIDGKVYEGSLDSLPLSKHLNGLLTKDFTPIPKLNGKKKH